MTKTMTALLLEMEKSPFKQVSITFGFWTGCRHGAYGNRNREAARALVKAGMAVIVSEYKADDHIGNSSVDHWTELVLQRCD